MRLRSLKYPFFLVYELARLWALLQLGATGFLSASAANPPVSWYAAVPLLCLTPTIFFIAIFDEESVHAVFPVVTAIKALGIPGFVVYIVKNFADAIRFAAGGELSILKAILALTAFGVCDAIIGANIYRSARQPCK